MAYLLEIIRSMHEKKKLGRKKEGSRSDKDRLEEITSSLAHHPTLDR